MRDTCDWRVRFATSTRSSVFLPQGISPHLNYFPSAPTTPELAIFRHDVRRILFLPFLRSSSVAAFRGPNSDNRNEACLAVSRQAGKIVAPEAPHSHADFLSIHPDSSSEGERCMKHTDHPVVHFLVHLMIFRSVRSRRSYAGHDDQFGRGQNTGLGWSDPTFVHVSVPKVIRGVAPAQLRGNRAEYFVRAAFSSRRPQ